MRHHSRRAKTATSAAPSPYRATREVFDAAEATYLLAHGWHLEEVRTLSKWSHGYHSETTSYLLGLPRHALHDVAAVSLSL